MNKYASGNGPGVLAEIASKLYAPFVTTKSLTLGIGLATSLRSVAAIGGGLWHTPGDLRGTIFQIALPLSERT